MKIELLSPNTNNPAIVQWKKFLKIIGSYKGCVDDHYDLSLLLSIKEYQQYKKLEPDGRIGNQTWLEAYKDGMVFLNNQKKSFPLKPKFSSIESNQLLLEKFGEILYSSNPIKNNPENVIILNDFETKNIIQVEIPQLVRTFHGANKIVRFHRKAAEQLRAFFNEIEKQGMLSLLLSYGGSFNSRLVRGSKTVLSKHCFGIAFDINMQWNPFNGEPIALGMLGSIRELVPLAHQYGFYWGGHFSRKDGMHFEIAQLL